MLSLFTRLLWHRFFRETRSKNLQCDHSSLLEDYNANPETISSWAYARQQERLEFLFRATSADPEHLSIVDWKDPNTKGSEASSRLRSSGASNSHLTTPFSFWEALKHKGEKSPNIVAAICVPLGELDAKDHEHELVRLQANSWEPRFDGRTLTSLESYPAYPWRYKGGIETGTKIEVPMGKYCLTGLFG